LVSRTCCFLVVLFAGLMQLHRRSGRQRPADMLISRFLFSVLERGGRKEHSFGKN
jgi:hypothetical protein